MNAMTRRAPGTRTLDHAVDVVGTNARQTEELLTATGEVVTRRLALGAAALIDPANADHREFAKIIPEKTLAFSEAGVNCLAYTGKFVEQLGHAAAREMASFAEATVTATGCLTPAGMMVAQNQFAAAWLTRTVAQTIAFGTLVLQSQGAAMAPLHRAATANARRLGA